MRIAVTGGIAEGKSTVMRYLQELGEATVSSDEIARGVFQEKSVQETLGRLLGVAAPIAPALLRERVSEEPGLRRKVNSLMHPLIQRQIDASPARWFEVPLLFETCLQSEFDRVWVVTCGYDIQLQRLSERLGDAPLAKRLIATQLSSDVKVVFADEVVRTNLPQDVVLANVRLAVRREIGK